MTIMPEGRQRYYNNDGTLAAGCLLYTYAAGTSAPKVAYQDSLGTIPHTNPIILDAKGEAFIYWSGSYKIDLKTAAGAQITGYPVDNVAAPFIPADLSPSAGAGLMGFSALAVYAAGSIGRWLTDLATSTGAGLLGFLYGAAYGAGTLGRWLQDLALGTGSSFIGFLQTGVGGVVRPVQDVLREQHSCLNFYLAAEATADPMINRAITAHNRCHIPAGIYLINAGAGGGIKLKTGTVLTGDGKNKTILSGVLGTGGSVAQIAAYSAGSIIRREFNPAGVNAYVNDGYIADIGVVLNHPAAAVTTSAIQVGFDMRNISTFTIERCHVGNIAPVGGALVKAYTKAFAVQGYPVVFGNVSGSDPAYAGGEKNRFLNNSVYGGYKCVVQDDVALSGSSASYATIIRDNDIQTGHWLIAQMGQYGAGNLHYDNILQDIQKLSGDVSNSYLQYYDGYNNFVRPAYVEAGGNCDYQLYLDTDANNNVIDMLMAGVTSGAGAITDNSNAGSNNRITYCGLTGVGPVVEMINKSPRRQWVKFHWDGAAIVIDGWGGLAVPVVTRTGPGDYLVTWGTLLPTANYSISVALDTNASGHGGTYDIFSHSTSNLRLFTYGQNAGVSTILDPRYVWVGASQ
jgi:hypothetical protein